MSLSLNNIVNVQLNITPTAPLRNNFGMMALFTSEIGEVFKDQNTLYQIYTSQQSIELDFGVSSETAKASSYFWMQSPKPKQMMVARWIRNDVNIDAVKASLRGTPLLTDLSTLQQITNGCMTISVNGTDSVIQNIDLSEATDFEDIASIINNLLPHSLVEMRFDSVGNRYIIEAVTAGVATKLSYVKQGEAVGTYIGSLLRLENGMAQLIAGADAVTLAKQTLAEAMSALNNKTSNWWAATCAASLIDDEIVSGANWVMASDKKMFGVTTQNPDHIENTSSNIFKDFYDRQMYRVVALYDKNDPYAITSFLARGMSVNFSAQNSTLTMKFKQLPGITPDDLTETEAAKCKALGINFYTYYDQSAMVAEGTVCGGRFFDEVHILDWYVDAVQKQVFTTLYQSPTKIPLTDFGTERLNSAIKSVCREGVNNGAFAAGVWNGDPFGTLNTGDYLDEGFYVWSDTTDNLTSSDREQRKAPPSQVALKMAGAIHSVDVIVNFDR